MEKGTDKEDISLNSKNENPDGQTQKVVPEEDYKNLQSEFTRNRQALIDNSIKLAESNPKEILSIWDKTIQDKVIEKVYGFKNLNELKSVMWDNFYETSKEDQNDVEVLKKEVSLLKYRSDAEKVEAEIKAFKIENKEIFQDNEDAENKLRESLWLLSKDIPIDERIKKAWILAFWNNYINNSTNAYQKLTSAQISWGSLQNNSNKIIETEKQKENKEFISKLFKEA